MKLKTLQIQRVVDEAAEAILDKILEEGLKPGDQLPSQGELSAQLGIGRSSIREAVQRLLVLGVVKVEHGRHMTVGNVAKRTLPNNFFKVESALRSQACQDVLEVRALLEPELAALAAQRAEPAQVQKLEMILEQMLQASSIEKLRELTRDFHHTLAQCTQNEAAVHILAALDESAQPLYQNIDPARFSKGDQAALIHQYEQMLQALKARDETRMRLLMQQHAHSQVSEAQNSPLPPLLLQQQQKTGIISP
jgi:GntR family transcriptional regulator, transcriptional repressor for pyruvate dehydrogenase complex